MSRPRPPAPAAPARPREPDRPPAESGKWLAMRQDHGPAPRMPSPGSVVGRPEGPPPPNELHPPDRAPLPIPGKGPGPLGPEAKPDGNGGYRVERLTFTARVARDGTVKIEDAPAVEGRFTGLGMAVSYDITDMIMRAIGDDPYAFEKLKLLDSTREARVVMARDDRRERAGEALARFPRDLAKIWAHERWSEAERRRVLFRLWDEVLEEGDPEIVRAGAQIRSAIYTFIRQKLPADGPSAFTEEELLRLNRDKKSRARFDPYSER